MRTVLLAAPDLAAEPELVTEMTASGSPLQVVRRCVDAVDLLGAATAAGVGIALVGAGLPRLSRETVSRLRSLGIDVIGLVGPANLPAEHALRGLDVSDVVVVDDPRAAVRAIAERAAAAQVASGEHTLDPDLAGEATADEPRTIGVWGAPGGPGVTSVAIGLSEQFAAAGAPTFLVDADPVGGAVAIQLGMVEEASGLAIAARRADQGTLTAEGLARAARALRPNFRVLTGIDSSERMGALRPAALATLTRMARLLAQVIVVDAGTAPLSDDGHRAALTRAVLQECDALVVVGAADPIGMARLLPTIASAREWGIPVQVVVTRVRASVLGRDARAQVLEALQHHAGIDDAIVIPDDRAAYDEALREGRTLTEHAPRSPVCTALADLARALSSIDQCLKPMSVPAA